MDSLLQVGMSGVCRHSTLKRLLLTGLLPVGSTMYVWGGGWNREDTGAGRSARSLGVSPVWKSFFERQTGNYDYRLTRYQIEDGLDCSGYIGWCIYNILNTVDGETGYVMPAGRMAECFAARGWGVYTGKNEVSAYRAGDIMSSGAHVWMVVGPCGDGSVVLLHSSPPGVRLAGTAAPGQRAEGEAVKLAGFYMKKYFPDWYNKYPDCGAGGDYLTQYGQMRWDITGNAVMTDPEGYHDMCAEEILRDLFLTKGE